MSGLNIQQPGLILFTEHYEQTVTFYRDGLGLCVLHETATLTSLGVQGMYLMVERGGVGAVERKSRAQNPTVLRLDVTDLGAALSWLSGRGVAAERVDFGWGSIGVLHDPDGNRVELKQT